MILCDAKGRSIILDSKGNINTLCIMINFEETIDSETIDLYLEGLSKIVNHKNAFRYIVKNTDLIGVIYKNLDILMDGAHRVYIGDLNSHKYNGQIEIIPPSEVKIQFNRFLKFYNNG